MKFIIYKTTNLINDKYYIGYHQTNNEDDNYLGSGKILKNAIKKHGKENFKKEILFVFKTKEEALLKEFEIINKVVISDKQSYNLKAGGEGGWDYINDILKNDLNYRLSIQQKALKTLKENYASGKLDYLKKEISDRNKRLIKEGKYKNFIGMGRSLSEETKKKISDNNANKLSTEKINNIKSIVEKSDIDFSKYGWVSNLAPLLNRKPQKVNYIMKKYLPDFYKNKCFQRLIKNKN